MRKIYLFLTVLAVFSVGCWSDATTNENASENLNQNINANVQNTNIQNVNENSEPAAEILDEEVPKFEDAKEALDKGTEYFDKNRTENAIDAFKQAVELDPDLAEAHFKLGVAYALRESDADAKVKAEEEEEKPADTPKKKAKKEKDKKSKSEIAFENSIKAYNKYLRKNPEDAEAFYDLGRAYSKLGEKNDEDARQALEKAVKIDDENSLYRTELGYVFIKLAKYDQAISQLNKAIKLQPDNFRAEDLLEEAREGKKRVDFGKDKDK